MCRWHIHINDLDSGFSKRLRVLVDGKAYLGWNPRGLENDFWSSAPLQTTPEIYPAPYSEVWK
jgi:hypothetical protein